MTIISEFQSARANSSAIEALANGDIAVVSLWSVLGLCISVVFVMAGFTADVGVFQAIAW